MFVPIISILAFLLLSACSSVPEEKSATAKAPVVAPKEPKATPKTPEAKKLPPLTPSMVLPSGWSVMDPKAILDKVEYKPELGGVAFTLKPNLNLELFSAEDAEKRSFYKGKVNSAHLVTLPVNQHSVLVVFTNRQNARYSILLKYQ